MKKLFVCFQAVLFLLIISGCDRPKGSSENQTVNEAPDQPVDSASRSKRELTNVETMLGSQVIEKAFTKLNTKLELGDQQAAGLKDILSQTFLGMGEDLNKKYTAEEAKTISRNMIQNSAERINGILDENQKQKFNTFLHH